MTKRNKKSPLKSKPSPIASEATLEGVLAASIATLSLGINALRDEIGKIIAGTAKKSRHDNASRVAFLTSKVGSIADSLRKVQAAHAKRFDDITPAIALAWLRQLDASDRQSFLREASQIDARKSGLA